MSTPIFSIICAIHNSESTLLRMLNSILDEDLDFEWYEIIAVDDCSTDSSNNILHQFRENHPEVHMSILKTPYGTIHCPSNTRQYGLFHACGRWIRFIDGDDIFVNHGCKKFLEYVNHLSVEPAMVKSEILRSSSDSSQIEPYPTNVTLLHGNFYNRAFLVNHDILFYPNMKLFEDMYFNSCCFSNVFYFENPNTSLGYMSDVTYQWVEDSNSLSNEIMAESKGHVELYQIDDWIKSSFDPFEKYLHIWPVPNQELFKNRICQICFGLYYYYENALYRKELDDIDTDIIIHSKESIVSCLSSINKICTDAFRVDMNKLMNDHSDIFCEQYFLVTDTNNYFVPIHSYDEFIKSICESL